MSKNSKRVQVVVNGAALVVVRPHPLLQGNFGLIPGDGGDHCSRLIFLADEGLSGFDSPFLAGFLGGGLQPLLLR